MNRFFLIVVSLALAMLPGNHAHPGHDLLEHGSAHVIGSTFHLTVVAVLTLLMFAAGALVTKPRIRRSLKRFGFAGVACFAFLWMLGL
jgi:hypothetical protein